MLTFKEYGMQRASAKYRGIEFRLTFEEWCSWWQDTGVAHLRGKGAGKYVMSRHGDAGAYELGNIKCLTHEENTIDGWFNNGLQRGQRIAEGLRSRKAACYA